MRAARLMAETGVCAWYKAYLKRGYEADVDDLPADEVQQAHSASEQTAAQCVRVLDYYDAYCRGKRGRR